MNRRQFGLLAVLRSLLMLALAGCILPAEVRWVDSWEDAPRLAIPV